MSGVPADTSNRIGHFKPNDTLHFHNRINQRSNASPGWNEPVYQYRETRLEVVPKQRTSATFHSSALSNYDYPSNQKQQKMPTSEMQQNYVGKKNEMRDYYLDNDSRGMSKQDKLSNMKPYQKNPYHGGK